MKVLVVASIFGGLMYFVFFYETTKENKAIYQEKIKEEILKDEFDIESTSYQGAITQTYHKYKDAVQGANSAVKQMENR